MLGSKRGISLFIATLTAGIALYTGPVFALADGQAMTPPMGWSSWNWFGCTGTKRPGSFHGNQNGIGVSEGIAIQIADAMVSSGMKDAGYKYVNLDDCYLDHNRSASGGLMPLTKTFPHGIKAVADSVHKRGLKFGVYTCVFEYTCANLYDVVGQGQPGMWGHEQQDADSFVVWGVDYVKVDYCGYQSHEASGLAQTERIRLAKERYTVISQALKTAVTKARAAGKPANDMVFSICEWGSRDPFSWAPEIGHLWRTNNDIGPTFVKLMEQIVAILDNYKYTGPGHWNDPDMMEVGNGLTVNEDRVHFALWSIMAAPMIAGNDLRGMKPETIALLSNKEANAINQDPLGLQGRKVGNGSTATSFTVSKKLVDGSYAVLFVNAGASTANVSATWTEIGSIDPDGVGIPSTKTMYVRDLLAKADLGTATGSFSKSVGSHDAFFFKLSASPVGIGSRSNSEASNAFDFFINRGDNEVKIHSTYLKPASFTLFDVKGSALQKTYMKQDQVDWVISANNIKPGIYFVSMKAGNRSIQKKLIIK